MAAPDIDIYRVASDPVALDALERLLDGPATQKEIAAAIGVSSAQLSRTMASLESTGVVNRERSHGPYVLFDRQLTAEMLFAVSDLQRKISQRRAEESDSRWTRLRRKTGQNGDER